MHPVGQQSTLLNRDTRTDLRVGSRGDRCWLQWLAARQGVIEVDGEHPARSRLHATGGLLHSLSGKGLLCEQQRCPQICTSAALLGASTLLAHCIDHMHEVLIAISAHAAPLHRHCTMYVHGVQAHTFKKLGLWMGILASSFSW